jgi:hypothetical protein
MEVHKVCHATIPEPGSVVLFGTGTLCLIGYAWQRRKLAA